MADEQQQTNTTGTQGVEQDGGTSRYVPPVDTATQETLNAEGLDKVKADAAIAEEAANKPPEGFDSWEAYGRAVAKGEATPPVKEKTPTEADDKGAPEGTVQERVAKAVLTEEQTASLAETLKDFSPEMGPKVEPYIKLHTANGSLTDEEVSAAAKDTGFPEDMIRQYMRGGDEDIVQAALATQTKPFFDLAGGADQWGGFQAYANKDLTPEDHAAINKAIDEGRPQDLSKYVEAWKKAGGGPAPRDATKGGGSGGEGGTETQGYASLAQQKAAMADPRYSKDEAYRAEVIEKMRHTKF